MRENSSIAQAIIKRVKDKIIKISKENVYYWKDVERTKKEAGISEKDVRHKVMLDMV